MFRLKGCPRCKGDLIINRFHRVWYQECLQCGYELELAAQVSSIRTENQTMKVES
jgi:Zn ribbon nucleic-acid-binding protein